MLSQSLLVSLIALVARFIQRPHQATYSAYSIAVSLSLRLPPILGSMELWRESCDSPTPPTTSPDIARDYSASNDRDVCEVILSDSTAQDEARSLIGMTPWILLRCSQWTMIPLENLIAASTGSGTRIAVAIDSADDIAGAAFALQIGVDAIVLKSENVEDQNSVALWSRAREILLERGTSNKDDSKKSDATADYIAAAIINIESVGIGDRVCLDLIELLNKGEGACIGSNANALPLLHGETIESQYVPTRPFRINAGACSNYVLMENEKTKYLSEVKSGEKVVIGSISNDGIISERSVAVGRVKIERRPFLKISYANDELNFSGHTIVQQAETVKLIRSTDHTAVSVTDLEVGDRIFVRRDAVMRHIGTAVSGGYMKEK